MYKNKISLKPQNDPKHLFVYAGFYCTVDVSHVQLRMTNCGVIVKHAQEHAVHIDASGQKLYQAISNYCEHSDIICLIDNKL